jgi:6-phosphogluconolactonase
VALEVEIFPDAEAASARGAEVIAATAQAVVAERGLFAMAVSGGRNPWTMFSALYERMPWEKVTIFQVDERVAPDDDPDRNLTHLLRSLPAGGVADVRPMPVTAHDLDAAAAMYERALPEAFDLVHLGLGPDGHTASLVPGDPVVEVTDRDVALTREYQGRRRMTLTLPVLNRARRLLWLVTGPDKVDALARLRAGDTSIPAGNVATANALVLADAAAAAGSAS